MPQVLHAATLNFHVKEALEKVGMWTIDKLIPVDMGIAVGILSLGDTEPEIPREAGVIKSQWQYPGKAKGSNNICMSITILTLYNMSRHHHCTFSPIHMAFLIKVNTHIAFNKKYSILAGYPLDLWGNPARSVQLTGKDMHYGCKVQTYDSGITRPSGHRILR